MDFLNSFRKYKLIRTGISLMIIGLIFAGFCIFAIALDGRNDATFAETAGTITKITATPSISAGDDSGYEYSVLVTYTVDGTEYRDVSYNSYSSSMKEGGEVRILYNTDDPSEIKAPGSDIIPYALCAIGIAAFIGGIVLLRKGIKAKKEDFNEYDKVDISKFTPEEIAEIENSTEEKEDFVFHYDGHFKQGYIMENRNREPVYEAKMTKMGIFTPFVFDFINHFTARNVTRKIGHTVTTSFGAGDIFAFDIPSKKSFTVDGQNNWEFLAANGYSFEIGLKGIAATYRVKHCGVEVAEIRTAGTNVMTGKDYSIGNLPVNGIYNVTCRRSDIDMVFMVCFSIARAIFFER